TTPDETGHGHHAQLDDAGGQGTITFGVPGAIAGERDGAVTVAGGARIFVGAPHPLSFSGHAPYSIEAWVRVERHAVRITFGTCITDQTEATGFPNFLGSAFVSHKRYGGGSFEEALEEPVSLATF